MMSRDEAPVSAFAAAKSLKRKRNGDATASAPLSQPSMSADSTKAVSVPVTPSRPRMALTTFDPATRKPVKQSNGSLSFRMTKGERACFLGVYDLTVEQGAVQVFGAVLTPESGAQRVYASALTALPEIFGLSQECIVTLRAAKNYLRRLARISKLYKTAFPLCSATEALQLSPYSACLGDSGFYCAHYSDTAGPDADLFPFRCPTKWIQTFETLLAPAQRQPSVFVCGAKKSGKSSFCRALINHALTNASASKSDSDSMEVDDSHAQKPSCFLLDLDPGQPETTPPGQVSLVKLDRPLLGSPISCPSSDGVSGRRTIRMHTLASPSPQDDFEYYMQCVSDLAASCRQAMQHYPDSVVIINTPGWITGEGLEAMSSLLRCLDHTAIVAIGLSSLKVKSRQRDLIRETLQSVAGGSQFLDLKSEASTTTVGPTHRTAAELRAMLMQSYFHLKRPSRGLPRWAAEPLSSYHSFPLALSYAGKPDILGLVSLASIPRAGLVAPFIRNSVVAVCLSEDMSLTAQMREAIQRIPSTDFPCVTRHFYAPNKDFSATALPDPRRSRTLALAYVKDVDMDAKIIMLITPAYLMMHKLLQMHHDRQDARSAESEDEAAPSLFLVIGNFDAPLWAHAEELRYKRHARSVGAATAASKALPDTGIPSYIARRDLGSARRGAIWRPAATARFAKKA